MTLYRPGEGAIFLGGPGRLPMRIERAVRTPDGSWTLETDGARYFLDAVGGAIAGALKAGNARKSAFWRPSLPLTGLRLRRQTATEIVLASELLTIGLQCDGLLVLVPHRALSLRLSVAAPGSAASRASEGRVLFGDERSGMGATISDAPLATARPPRFEPLTPRQEITDPRSGWAARWRADPGERLALGVFPPRPASQIAPKNVESLERGDATVERVGALRRDGRIPLLALAAEDFADAGAWLRALRVAREGLGTEGIVLRGLEKLNVLAAYERIRTAREIFATGLVLLPSPAKDSFCLPFIDGYTD